MVSGSRQIAQEDTAGAGGILTRLAGPACLLVAALAALPVFWIGFERLLQEWAQPEFRFKAIIPAFSLILFLQVLRSVPPPALPLRFRWLGIVGVIGALVLAFLGVAIDVEDFIFMAIIGWFAAMLVIVFGLPRAFVFWAPVASLLMMVPVPRVLLNPIHALMERLAVDVGMGILRLIGVPVRLEERTLDFGVHAVPVVEMTAGLVNFLPILLVFFLFATVFRGPLWSRLVPLVLTAPVMVLLTSIRIAAVGLAVDLAGAGGAQRVVSLTGNWVFFVLCVAVLLALVLAALRLAGHRRRLRDSLDFDIGGIGSQFGRVFTIRPTRALITAALLSVATSWVLLVGTAREPEPITRDAFSLFPPDIGGWSGTSSRLAPGVESVLAADDYILMDFYHPDERAPVNFWVAYYAEQGRGVGAIHSPQNCLPNDDWRIATFESVVVETPGSVAGGANVNRAIIEKDGTRALMYYWFDGRGRRLTHEQYARLLVKTDDLVRRRTDGALVRYVTAIMPDETDADADARLQRFMGQSIDLLPRFLPE